MNPTANSGIFRRQTESVEADGMEDIVALHPAEPSVAIRGGHSVPMTDMQVSRGVRIHGHFVPFGPGVVMVYPVQTVLVPTDLPLVINGCCIVAQLYLPGAGAHLPSPLGGSLGCFRNRSKWDLIQCQIQMRWA